MLFGAVDLLAQLGNLGNPARPPEWKFVSAAGLVLLIVAMATTNIRKRPFLLEPVLVPILVVVVIGSGLVDSVATFGVCIGATVAQSMYGSHWAWALRTVLLCAAFLSAVAVSPYSIGGRWISWHSPTLIAMVPQLLMLSVLVGGLYFSLLHQYRAGERVAIRVCQVDGGEAAFGVPREGSPPARCGSPCSAAGSSVEDWAPRPPG